MFVFRNAQPTIRTFGNNKVMERLDEVSIFFWEKKTAGSSASINVGGLIEKSIFGNVFVRVTIWEKERLGVAKLFGSGSRLESPVGTPQAL